MAKLNEFLGGIFTSINEARINSDLQSIKIANEYSGNELLKHFSVPRLRLDKVELNIPIAINELVEKTQNVYKPIDSKSFSTKVYQQVLKTLSTRSLPKEVSTVLKNTIDEHIKLVEAKIKLNQVDNILEDFSKKVAFKVTDMANTIYKNDRQKEITDEYLAQLHDSITKGLQESLKDEIKITSEKKILGNLDVLVEANKLSEVSPNKMIMIKMTIFEQGMEWTNIENSNGDVVSKLLPE